MKLDKRNKHLLQILNINSREKNSVIANKLKISKQAVAYRIDALVKSGIIKNFYTELDLSRLGFNTYYIFLQLESISQDIELELIKKFADNQNIGWIIRLIGKWNIILTVYSRSMNEFCSTLAFVKKVCGEFLRDSNFSILLESYKLSYRFLDQNLESRQTEKDELKSMDDTDKKILKCVSQNARLNLVDISKQTRLNIQLVFNRMIRLKNSGIIKGFRLKLDVSKMGYEWYILFINLSNIDNSTKLKLNSFLENQSEVYYLTSIVGSYDLIIDLHISNTLELERFVNKIKDKFPESIKFLEMALIISEHKISYTPNL